MTGSRHIFVFMTQLLNCKIKFCMGTAINSGQILISPFVLKLFKITLIQENVIYAQQIIPHSVCESSPKYGKTLVRPANQFCNPK